MRVLLAALLLTFILAAFPAAAVTFTDTSQSHFDQGSYQQTMTDGQNVTISLKLPTEKSVVRLKATVKSQNSRGIGCQFIYKNHKERKSIYECFEFFKDSLPIE